MKLHRDGDRLLQLLIFNEECLVSASHQLALITSLPFVHTARRSYRLDVLVKRLDWRQSAVTLSVAEKFVKPSHLEEGEVVTRFPFAAPCRSLSRPKGCPPRLDRTKTTSGLKALVTKGTIEPLLATPSNCGDAHPTLEHQAARRQGARGRGNDPGYGNSVESSEKPMCAIRNRRKWVIRSQVRSDSSFNVKKKPRGRMLFTDYMAVGGCATSEAA